MLVIAVKVSLQPCGPSSRKHHVVAVKDDPQGAGEERLTVRTVTYGGAADDSTGSRVDLENLLRGICRDPDGSSSDRQFLGVVHWRADYPAHLRVKANDLVVRSCPKCSVTEREVVDALHPDVVGPLNLQRDGIDAKDRTAAQRYPDRPTADGDSVGLEIEGDLTHCSARRRVDPDEDPCTARGTQDPNGLLARRDVVCTRYVDRSRDLIRHWVDPEDASTAIGGRRPQCPATNSMTEPPRASTPSLATAANRAASFAAASSPRSCVNSV